MAIQLREFAEQVLFGKTLEEKLGFPREEIVDTRRGYPLRSTFEPGRPDHLALRAGGVRATPPTVSKLIDAKERGKLLHYFCNHELLAAELMALALLKFPDAPACFRSGLLETLKEEQVHTRLYLHRMKQCGVEFGELPLSDYFWKRVSSMEDPLDYVTRLSLTFEQANLDYSRDYAQRFEQEGDRKTAGILSRIYQDEIGHVGFGLKWFRRWKAAGKTDWEVFREKLVFPLSPVRAKGKRFNREGRLHAGLNEAFVSALEVYEQSRGRTPTVYWFNPDAETFAGRNAAGDSGDWISTVGEDLSFLPAFLSRQGDLLITAHSPSNAFLRQMKDYGFTLPEILVCSGREKAPVPDRKIGAIRPWAWTPDSLAFFQDSFSRLTRKLNPDTLWNPRIRNLFSKVFSADWGRTFERDTGRDNWNAALPVYGAEIKNPTELREQQAHLASLGYPDVVCKAPFATAAGGNRILPAHAGVTPQLADWLEGVWEQQGSILVEPWLNRVYDFSVQYEMRTTGLKLVAFTRLINNTRGQFRGIMTNAFCKDADEGLKRFLMRPGEKCPRVYEWYEDHLRPQLETTLRETGFLGPLGVDALVFRDPNGRLKLKSVVEFNPRMTMGRIAHELGKHTAGGVAGLFQIFSRKDIRRHGFPDFADYVSELKHAHPVLFSPGSGRSICSGSFPVTDPATAKNFLAVFHARKTIREILPLLP